MKMKNVKGYKFTFNENYTEESHDDYIAWAYKRIGEIDGLLNIRFKDSFSSDYREQLIKEQDYLMAETSAAYDSWMDYKYNL